MWTRNKKGLFVPSYNSILRTYEDIDDITRNSRSQRAPVVTKKNTKYVSVRGREYYFDAFGAIESIVLGAGWRQKKTFGPIEQFQGYWICPSCEHCNDILDITEWPDNDVVIYCARCGEEEVLEGDIIANG